MTPRYKHQAIKTVAISLLSLLTIRRLWRLVKTSSSPKPQIDNRTTLCFGGAASLSWYYAGVYYYLWYHFDLTNVRCTGLSMGVPSCFAVALKIKPLEKFRISLEWASMIWSRPLKCFFMRCVRVCGGGGGVATRSHAHPILPRRSGLSAPASARGQWPPAVVAAAGAATAPAAAALHAGA